MPRSSALLLATAAASLVLAAPASAKTTTCGTAKGVSGASVTKVTTSSGTCLAAKTVAKGFARTRVAPKGYTCKEKFSGTMAASVTCSRPSRRVTFKVSWTGSMPLPPAPALPIVNS